MDNKEAAKYLRDVLELNSDRLERDLISALIMGAAALEEVERRFRVPIVCMCGSTRFKQTWIAENARLTGEGNIVLSVGLWGHHERQYPDAETKLKLDELHKRKIDLADWVWVLDVGHYIGESTKSEIDYAKEHGKTVRYLSVEYPGYKEPIDPLLEKVERLREEARKQHRIAAEALEYIPKLNERIAELESQLATEKPDRYIEKGVISQRGPK